jgi:DNA-binding response OmpR family regulator
VTGQTAVVDPFRTLLVDDDTAGARRLALLLEEHLGPTLVVPDVSQALDHHAARPFDVVVLEVALPGVSGIRLLEQLAPAAPAVVLTWLVSPAITSRALHAGAHSVLKKPCRATDLLAAVRLAVRPRSGATYALA